jgi:hypothetical protein
MEIDQSIEEMLSYWCYKEFCEIIKKIVKKIEKKIFT